MRITGGKLGGRRVRSPRGDQVRPTSDFVREALFAMLVNDLAGASFLDLYAGSGVVGLEALSRGAGHVVWVEGDRNVIKTTRNNVAMVTGSDALVICAGVEEWLARSRLQNPFEIVFADPPYDKAQGGVLAEVAGLLRKHDIVAPGGLFVAEMPRSAPVAEWLQWRILRDRSYGRTRLVIARRID